MVQAAVQLIDLIISVFTDIAAFTTALWIVTGMTLAGLILFGIYTEIHDKMEAKHEENEKHETRKP